MKIGNIEISSLKVGSADCKVYLGSLQVYPNEPSYDQQYLTFVAKQNSTFKFSGNSISYSTNSGRTWTTLASNTNTPTVQSGHTIMWKATLSPSTNKGIGRFSSSGKFDVEGNAMSLLFGDNYSGQTSLSGKAYAFYQLFSGCTNITNAENMVLPAMTLSNYCYGQMFIECTSLKTAPQLPSKSLANDCYLRMFDTCRSLTKVQTKLPATTLTEKCYNSMFNGCTSLTTAPELPATTLTTNCYQSMFSGCSKLNYIKCLATSISASYCTLGWVSGVAANGTFVKASGMSSWTTGVNGIPKNWTVQDYS